MRSTNPLAGVPALTVGDFFMLRTPSKPLDWAFPRMPHLPASDWEDARLKDQHWLRAIVKTPDVREALYIASPSVVLRLEEIERGEAQWDSKLEDIVARYLIRMSSRVTPFGTFAGVSLGRVGEQSCLRVATLGDSRRHVRVDSDLVFSYYEKLLGDKELVRRSRLHTNESAYALGEYVMYVEQAHGAAGHSHKVNRVERTDYLDYVLELARREILFEDLASSLHAAIGTLPLEDVEAYLLALAEARLLLPGFRPTVTGSEPLRSLVAGLEAASSAVAEKAGLIEQKVRHLSSLPIGAPVTAYKDLQATLAEVTDLPLNNRFVQIDLARPSRDLALSASFVDEIRESVAGVMRLTGRPREYLTDFIKAFRERYEGEEIPLVEALDPELGIPFGSEREEVPFLGGVYFPQTPVPSTPGDAWRAYLTAHVVAAAASGQHEIDLAGEEWQPQSDRPPRIPTSLSATITLLPQIADDAPAFVLDSIIGPSGAAMLGRFTHVIPELGERVCDFLREEAASSPDDLFAEIVHLPEGRVGNIMCRQLLRDFEITYVGRSSVANERSITIEDLLISVIGDRVVLRSKRLGRRVRPRMSTAHNFSGRLLGVYKFLCLVQQSEADDFGFYWPDPLPQLPFLPRVRLGRAVLVPRRWRLTGTDLKRIRVGRTRDDRARAFLDIAKERGLPELFTLVEFDNKLRIDTTKPLLVHSAVEHIKDQTSVVLEECLEGYVGTVASEEGFHSGQVVVPFLDANGVGRANPSHLTQRAPSAPLASFPPGSEWTYVKLYCGRTTGDKVLLDLISPLMRELEGAQSIDKWFFLRYGDPQHHIRLRLHRARAAKYSLEDLCRHFAASVDRRLTWKTQLDTYTRETGRYGGDRGVPICESLFMLDSKFALACLALEREAGNAELRWMALYLSALGLLERTNPNVDRRLDIVGRWARAAGSILQANDTTMISLGKKFRALKPTLERLDNGGESEALVRLVNGFVEESWPLLRDLQALEREGTLASSVDAIQGSLSHMRAIRLFNSGAREHELVVYEMMRRHLLSRVARAKVTA